MRAPVFFVLLVSVFIAELCFLDRFFLKKNQGFCIRHIYAISPEDPLWSLKDNSSYSEKDLQLILSQPFTFLGKGHQSYVFVSRDGDYVLKFYHFPSYLRPLSWIDHPFSRFLLRRQKARAYNIRKFHMSVQSYQLAFACFREESGLIMTHLVNTQGVFDPLILVDTLGCEYHVDLDKTCCLLQKKGEMILPALRLCIDQGDLTQAKILIRSFVTLVKNRLQRGIRDVDAVLKKNYGCFNLRAFQLDVGRLVHDPSLQKPSILKSQLICETESLKNWLSKESVELFNYCNYLVDQY